MVDEEYDRKRLDQFLSSVYPEYSRSYFQKLIRMVMFLRMVKILKNLLIKSEKDRR